MTEIKRLTKWQTPPLGRVVRWVVAVWSLCALASVALMAACTSHTEERISARADAIEFTRIVGRKAAAGGFVLSRDSLVMRETK